MTEASLFYHSVSKKAEEKEFKIIIPKATFKGIWYLTTLLMRTKADERSAAEDNT